MADVAAVAVAAITITNADIITITVRSTSFLPRRFEPGRSAAVATPRPIEALFASRRRCTAITGVRSSEGSSSRACAADWSM
jgi:hypothetical protein